jgi:hypothetical protein
LLILLFERGLLGCAGCHFSTLPRTGHDFFSQLLFNTSR